MSITKSYNKHTDTYYAYETTYEWSDEKQRKVQRKRCIGQFDPETGEIIPNGKIGRPSVPRRPPEPGKAAALVKGAEGIRPEDRGKLLTKLDNVEETLRMLSSEVRELRTEILSLPAQDKQGR